MMIKSIFSVCCAVCAVCISASMCSLPILPRIRHNRNKYYGLNVSRTRTRRRNPFRDTCVTEIFDRVPPGTIASFACSFSQKKRNRVHDVSVCVSSNIERISKYADAEQWGMYGTVLASVLRQEKLIFKNWRTTKPTNEHTPHHTTGRVLPYAIFRNRCEICDTPALNYILSDFIFVVGIERLVLNASMAANAEWYAAAAEA